MNSIVLLFMLICGVILIGLGVICAVWKSLPHRLVLAVTSLVIGCALVVSTVMLAT